MSMEPISEGELRKQYQQEWREFHYAASNGDRMNVEKFVKKHLYSPKVLFYAAINNHYEMVDYLLSNGYGLHGEGLKELIEKEKKEMIDRIVQKNGFILSAPEVYKAYTHWLTLSLLFTNK